MAENNPADAPPAFKVGTRDKDAPWFVKDVAAGITPQARRLLENYSKIPAEQVESHVADVRAKAWEIFPYPCIGRLSFLHLSITLSPYYKSIISLLRDNPTSIFVDLGCCFGQEIRALTAGGAPSQNMVGIDLRPEYFELGYELFRDREELRARFLQADIMEEGEGQGGLKELEGRVDVVFVGSFLHLWGWEGQVKACERIVRLLKGEKGAMVVGRQVGDLVASQAQVMWKHSEESFRKMWKEVGEKTGTKWKVETEMVVMKDSPWTRQMQSTVRLIRFAVIRE